MLDAREVHDRAQTALKAIATGDRFAVRRAIEALEAARDLAAGLLATEAVKELVSGAIEQALSRHVNLNPRRASG